MTPRDRAAAAHGARASRSAARAPAAAHRRERRRRDSRRVAEIAAASSAAHRPLSDRHPARRRAAGDLRQQGRPARRRRARRGARRSSSRISTSASRSSAARRRRARGWRSCARKSTGKMAALVGHSGVGKSSILNALDESLQLATNTLHRKRATGRHTTIRVDALRLRRRHVPHRHARHPRVRPLGPRPRHRCATTSPSSKSRPSSAASPNCTHVHEPDCEVKERVERGELNSRAVRDVRAALARPGLNACCATPHAQSDFSPSRGGISATSVTPRDRGRPPEINAAGRGAGSGGHMRRGFNSCVRGVAAVAVIVALSTSVFAAPPENRDRGARARQRRHRQDHQEDRSQSRRRSHHSHSLITTRRRTLAPATSGARRCTREHRRPFPPILFSPRLLRCR